MQRSFAPYLILAAAGIAIVAAAASSAPTSTVLKAQIPIGNFGPKWSFDISYVDSAKGLYMLADRNSAALDVVDIKTSKLIYQIPGFTGFKEASKISGPQGIVGIAGTDIVYAGDVNSVKVVDVKQRKIANSIPTTTSGFRTDEGCYDPDDKIVMFNTPNDATPNSVFISTAKQAVLGKIQFPGAEGLEACSYDRVTKSFYTSVPATPKNPGGEIDVIRGSSAAGSSPVVSSVYPVTKCGPTGNVLGPTIAGKPQLLISCDQDKGEQLFVLVMNVLDGTVVKIPQVGAADQVDYNSKTNKYYLAARNYYASGVSGQGPQTPVLGVIDGGSATVAPHWLENVATCAPVGPKGCSNVAHSVATDPATGRTFVPVASETSSTINVYADSGMP